MEKSTKVKKKYYSKAKLIKMYDESTDTSWENARYHYFEGIWIFKNKSKVPPIIFEGLIKTGQCQIINKHN